MVMSPDPGLNLRADIKATLASLEARLRIGGNWRSCADMARELGHKLDALAELEQYGDRPRHRVIEPDVPPGSADEFLGTRLARLRNAAIAARQASRPGRRRTEITRIDPTVPELPGA